MAAFSEPANQGFENLQTLLSMRQHDLIQLRKELDLVNGQCKFLLKPWKGRDRLGKLKRTLQDVAQVQSSAGKNTSDSIRGGPPQSSSPLQSNHRKSVDVFDMSKVDEALAKAKRARAIEAKASSKKSTQQSASVPVRGDGTTKSTSSLASSTASIASNVASGQGIAQIYGSSQRRVKSGPAARLSSSNVANKTPGISKVTLGRHAKKTVTTKPSSKVQASSYASEGKKRSDRNAVQQPKKSNSERKEETAQSSSLSSPSLHRTRESPFVFSTSSANSPGPGKETSPTSVGGLCADQIIKNPTSEDTFDIAENGSFLALPSKYNRMRKAAQQIAAEIESQPVSTGANDFVNHIEQLDITNGTFSSTGEQGQHAQLLLFMRHCEDLKEQLTQVEQHSRTKQPKVGASPDIVLLKHTYQELKQMWERINRHEPVCMQKCPPDAPNPRQTFVYSTLQEWEACCRASAEVEQLRWEATFMKVFLEVIKPTLKDLTSPTKSTARTIQSLYSLSHLSRPVFLMSPAPEQNL